jgi:hypothetical protein
VALQFGINERLRNHAVAVGFAIMQHMNIWHGFRGSDAWHCHPLQAELSSRCYALEKSEKQAHKTAEQAMDEVQAIKHHMQELVQKVSIACFPSFCFVTHAEWSLWHDTISRCVG